MSLAREASTPGGVNAWTATRQIKPRNLPNKVNEYGFDTGSHGARAWWVVKSSTLPIPEFTTTPFDINGTNNERFGRRVALDGKHLLVGYDSGSNRKLHYYQVSETNGSLTPKSILTPDNESNNLANFFGQAFAVDGKFPPAWRIPYLSNHETESYSLAFSGHHQSLNSFSLNYHLQITSDSIESDTLNKGYFHDRDYFKLSLLPEYKFTLSGDENIKVQAGGTFDDTSRGKSKVSPIAQISWERKGDETTSDRGYLSYSQATQVIGYGAIAGKLASDIPAPLFASDPDLDREKSRNLELGYSIMRDGYKLHSAVFNRKDPNLVDWVYKQSAPNAREPKHVDVETFGFEIIGSRNWKNFEAIVGYSYLKKKEDYKDSTVDGSIYALNYPENRVTLGLVWDPFEFIEIRIDNEWRKQRENFLRQQDDSPEKAINSHFAASYYPSQIDDLEIFIAYDKPWDEDFQDVPGTPGRGDQFSLGATFSW